MADTAHKQGCDALGGYGNGVGACSCGADAQPLAPTDAEIAALAAKLGAGFECDTLLVNGKDAHDYLLVFARATLAKWGAQPLAREPLTDEQIFDCVNGTLPGKGHRVISETDPEYAKDVGIEPGARRIVSEVHPEHSIAFARAIERAHGIT